MKRSNLLGGLRCACSTADCMFAPVDEPSVSGTNGTRCSSPILKSAAVCEMPCLFEMDPLVPSEADMRHQFFKALNSRQLSESLGRIEQQLRVAMKLQFNAKHDLQILRVNATDIHRIAVLDAVNDLCDRHDRSLTHLDADPCVQRLLFVQRSKRHVRDVAMIDANCGDDKVAHENTLDPESEVCAGARNRLRLCAKNQRAEERLVLNSEFSSYLRLDLGKHLLLLLERASAPVVVRIGLTRIFGCAMAIQANAVALLIGRMDSNAAIHLISKSLPGQFLHGLLQ